MDETASLIKSCVISKKGGIPYESLNDEFKKLVGEPIPYNRLGFSNLRGLLKQVDGLEISRNEIGEVVYTVTDPKVTHIKYLIEKQKKDYFKAKNKQFVRFNPYSTDAQEHRQRNRDKRNTERKNTRYRQLGQRRNAQFFESDKLSISDEYEHPAVIESNSLKDVDAIYEPRVKGRQLIGDDFFMQLSIRNLGLPIWRQKDSLTLQCGLCTSGQTIKDCIQALDNIESISNRVTIMLGSVDIYNGASCDEMIADMEELLHLLHTKFSLSHSAITLCTIPPLGNISLYSHPRKGMALYAFNSWIRQLGVRYKQALQQGKRYDGYEVIDMFEGFVGGDYVIEYDYFQIEPRMVSGTKHAYLLWNKKGRKQAMKMLRGEYIFPEFF